MSNERNYPKFRNTRTVENRFAPQVAVMECTYTHLIKTFGRPTFSAENNDTFEGTEQCSWQIQFESGEIVTISEERGFGDRDHDIKNTTRWKVNSRSTQSYDWIKAAIRDSNPKG